MSQAGSAVSRVALILPDAKAVPTPSRAGSGHVAAARAGAAVSRAAGQAAWGDARKCEPTELTDRQLLVAITSGQARCASTEVDVDEWFPVSNRWEQARAEAARALAVCAECPVRPECLEFSMRQWNETGRYGVWGGLLEDERKAARKEWLTGVSVMHLLAARHERYISHDNVKVVRHARADCKSEDCSRAPTGSCS
jgi:WhiB family redox-sensing transcriptional regulator